MAKELTCEIVKDYFDIDDTEDSSIKICEVKWNGRKPKGYDIRKYDKESDRLFKGITITYDGFKELIYKSIENGLINIDELKESIEKRDKQIIRPNDFLDMFNKMNKENKKFNRDKFGELRNEDGLLVIHRKRRRNTY